VELLVNQDIRPLESYPNRVGGVDGYSELIRQSSVIRDLGQQAEVGPSRPARCRRVVIEGAGRPDVQSHDAVVVNRSVDGWIFRSVDGWEKRSVDGWLEICSLDGWNYEKYRSVDGWAKDAALMAGRKNSQR
jgi:hypothetical protein